MCVCVCLPSPPFCPVALREVFFGSSSSAVFLSFFLLFRFCLSGLLDSPPSTVPAPPPRHHTSSGEQWVNINRPDGFASTYHQH